MLPKILFLVLYLDFYRAQIPRIIAITLVNGSGGHVVIGYAFFWKERPPFQKEFFPKGFFQKKPLLFGKDFPKEPFLLFEAIIPLFDFGGAIISPLFIFILSSKK